MSKHQIAEIAQLASIDEKTGKQRVKLNVYKNVEIRVNGEIVKPQGTFATCWLNDAQSDLDFKLEKGYIDEGEFNSKLERAKTNGTIYNVKLDTETVKQPN